MSVPLRLRRLTLALLLLALVLRCTPAPELPFTPEEESDIWYLDVVEEGGVWIAPALLSALGVPSGAELPLSLRLSYGDQTLPYLPLETEAGWGLFFFAPALSTRYAPHAAFRLELAGEVPGARMLSTPAQPSSSPPAPAFATLRAEEDQRYLPQATAATPWFWEPLRAPGERAYPLTLPDARPGSLTATLTLWSHTSFRPHPDHRARLLWNAEPGGEWEWGGQGMQTLTASWQLEVPGDEHLLTLETPSISEEGIALVWIDRWEITYPSEVRSGLYRAGGAALAVPAGARVLNVTDPLAPRDLGPAPETGTIATEAGHRYWVGTPAEAPAPLTVRPAAALDVAPLADVTYLAVAPAPFHAALAPLLEHRAAEGLTTAVVTPQSIYDTFGTGQPHPEAIRALVRELPALRYLLLVGGAGTEPEAYVGEMGALRVVTPFTRTAVLGETPADALLAVDEEGRPRAAVGRFPVETEAALHAVVAKTLAWERAIPPMAALLLQDNEAEFRNNFDSLASLIPGGTDAPRLELGEDDARAELLAALDGAPTWLHYNGHGSLVQLGDEGILKWDEGGLWSEPAVVVAWTCLAAHFTHARQPSMGEAWLQEPQGGAVAFLGPVGETTTFQQRFFAERFYAALATETRLGDAWLRALQAEGGAPDVRWGFVLLGDPALRLPE